MKIAIHHRKGSFSGRWIEYCEKNNVPYKVVNAFDNNIIEQLNDCDAFLWHHHHAEFKDVILAKKVLFALEQAGISVYPDFNTGWHFDDKVAQKYLLEAINAPMVRSYVFYNKREAIKWAKATSYPKVFKLKGGAGAANVRLIKNRSEALKVIKKSFGRGFSQYNRLGNLYESIQKYKKGRGSINGLCKSIVRLAISTDFARNNPPEKGYVYFQEFMPNNKYDIRVIVVGNRAIAAKRYVRENDFRASGSGNIDHRKEAVNIDCIKLAFEIKNKLNAQSISFDFVFDSDNNPLIVEVSYGFPVFWADSSKGYWDEELKWHDNSNINPQHWITENLISEISFIKAKADED